MTKRDLFYRKEIKYFTYTTTKSREVLLQLQDDLCHTIGKEIMFTCCSRLPNWAQASRSMLVTELHKDDKNCDDDATSASSTGVDCGFDF